MLSPKYRRSAFTMIELLVVILLILIITALGAMVMPSVQDRNMQSAADRLQGWLLIAKQRAKREGLATGLSIQFNPTTLQASQCTYIQQPEDYCPYGTTCSCGGTTAVTFYNGVNSQGGPIIVDLVAAGVQPGDYLEFNRSGGSYQILSVNSSSSLTLVVNGPNLVGAANPNGTTNEYRVRRQPIPLVGEDVLQLPDGIVLDNTVYSATVPQKCLNLPVRTVGTNSYYEILFSPQGGVVGRGTGSDQICVLWLTSLNNANATSLLLAIQKHTGFIGVQQQNVATTDPFAGCRDPRASGM